MWRASVVYWFVQFTGWGAFCILLAITRYAVGELDNTIYYQLAQLYILLIALSHSMRFVLLRFDWINLKLGPLIPRVITLNFISAIVLLIIVHFLSALYTEDNTFRAVEFFINSAIYSLFFMLWTAIYLTYHLIKKSREQELLTLKLVASNHEIELKTLRDQLNPHFLFNSLNSIRALIEIEPKVAKSAITTLSNLLRSSLLMGKKSLVTLSEELDLVQKYLELEKIRFEERLHFSFDIQAPSNLLIPPFIIQTLTENAIKHGISKSTQNGFIDVIALYKDDELIISVENSGTYRKEKTSNGIGLRNTKRRLQIQYNNDAQFTIFEHENKVKAQIKINFKNWSKKIN